MGTMIIDDNDCTIKRVFSKDKGAGYDVQINKIFSYEEFIKISLKIIHEILKHEQ